MNNVGIKKTLRVLGIIFLVVMLCEVFVFNFRAISSSGNEELLSLTTEYGNKKICDIEDEDIKIKTEDDLVIKIKEIDDVAKNLKLDIEAEGLDVIPVIISAKDEGNSQFVSYPKRDIARSVEASKYIPLNLAGDAREIKIELKGTAGKEVTVNSIAINTKVPMNFSFLRIFVVWLIFAAIYILRPSSFVYNVNPDKKRKRVIICIFLIVNILLLLFLVNVNPGFKSPSWAHHNQYHKLSEALMKGQLHLEETPPVELVEMENPYDYYGRGKEVGRGNYLWDHAYYDGNYYVYFGVVPCILFYLPYYALTGTHLPTYIVVFIASSLSAIGITLVMREIIRKKFPDTPFAVYLIFCQMAISGGGLWLAAKRPDFYFVPIVTAIMLTLFGLYFWLTADKNEKLSTIRLALGSSFMALVAGSRPQFLLASFFVFVIFAKDFKEKRILSKTSAVQTAAIALPYVIVATFLMYYNFARFGSVFDFGANYNLTINDMTRRGIRADRTFLGWFSYFIQPVQLSAVFPFIEECKVLTTYVGRTIYEEMYGGVLAANPFLWLGVLSIAFRKYFVDKKCFIITILCTIFALVISFADTQMAGILTRYFADFNLFLYFGTAITFMCLYKEVKSQEIKNILVVMLVFGLFFAVLYNAGLIFTMGANNVSSYNPDYFYKIKHLVAFWQ